jgi:alcohol dehydrogenase class IV
MRLADAGSLRKFYAPEFVFGEGALDLAGRYAQKLGITKALLVTDAGVLAAGWPAAVLESLEKADVRSAVYSAISPNPREHEVAAGAGFYRKHACDGLLAVGGGSPIDCAKGIGIVVANDRPVLEFEGVDGVPVPMPPMLSVPTTSGTAADISQFAIILDSVRKVKIAIISKAVVPDLSLIDPRTIQTMGPQLAADTGLDALTHAVEAYVSTGSSPLTDVNALEAVRLIRRHLLAFLRDPEEPEARAGMMLASLQAGLAFSNASLGAVHAMAHSLGGVLDLPHGACNAMLLASVIDYNFPAAPRRYGQIAEALGVTVAGLDGDALKQALLKAVCELRQNAGSGARLSNYGVTAADLPSLVRNALQDPCIATNPRIPAARDIEAIYERAL